MVDLGSAYFQLTPSLQGFSGTVTRQLGGVGNAAGKTAGGGFSAAFKSAIGPLAAVTAATIGIGAITGFVNDSISAASNLEQSIGGVDAVFGKSAKQIHKWAKAGAKDVGLSENSYNELAAVLGSSLKNSGQPLAEVGKQTNDLINLGADLSATFGGDAKSAIEAISSALRGERDPIERYGISLNQAAVDAEAAKLGFDKVGGSLSTQASQAATLSLIYKKSGAAQGQFAKQTDTLAEKQQIFNASLDNFKSKVGSAFLPVVSDMVGAVTDGLQPALEGVKPFLDDLGQKAVDFGKNVGSFFKGLQAQKAPAFMTAAPATGPVSSAFSAGQDLSKRAPQIQSAMDSIGQSFQAALPSLAAVAKDLLPALVQILPVVAQILPPLASILSSIAPLLPPLASALSFLVTNGVLPIVQNTSGFIDFFAQLLKKGGDTQLLMEGLNGKFGNTIELIGLIGKVVGSVIGTQILRVKNFVADIQKAFEGGYGNFFEAGKTIISRFIDGINSQFRQVGDAVGGLMDFVKGFFPQSPAQRGPFSGVGWTNLAKSGGAIAEQFTGGFNNGVTDFAKGASRMIPDTISSNVAGTITATAQAPATTVLVNNKTNIRLEDLIDIRIARTGEDEAQTQRLGYQPLVFA